MREKTLEAIISLKEALGADSRLMALEMAEKRMNESDEVKALSLVVEEKVNEYNATLHIYDSESNKAKESQRALFEAKYALDSHPLVKEYNQAYGEVRSLYSQIEDIVLSPYKHAHRCAKGGK